MQRIRWSSANSRNAPRWAVPWTVAALACAPAADPGPVGDSPLASPTAGPCEAGTWESLGEDPSAAVHVDPTGDDTSGDGSAAQPVATLAAALELTRVRAESDRLILVAPGAYDANLDLAGSSLVAGADDGVQLRGCSADEGSLAGGTSEPAIRITSATGVGIEGLTVEGGYRGIQAWAGAEVAIADSVVTGSLRAGIIFDGGDTIGDVTGSRIESIDSDGTIDAFGFGLVVQGGAAVDVSDTTVLDSVGIGVFVDNAELVATNLTVDTTTRSLLGTLGRGIQVQSSSAASVSGSTVIDSVDAGIYASQSQLTLTESVVSGVIAADAETGDGVVLSQLGPDEAQFKPSIFASVLTDNTIEAADRAGVIVEDIDTTVSGNVTGDSLYHQGGGELFGTDASIRLEAGDEFEIARQPIDAEALTGAR